MTASAPAPAAPATAPRHPLSCPCPWCVAGDGVALLRAGRADMALRRLEPLPELIRAGLAQAYRQGADEALAAARSGASRAPVPRRIGRHRRCDVLAHAIAEGRVTSGQVAALLRIEPRHVAALAEGRVGLPGGAWKRLMKDLGL